MARIPPWRFLRSCPRVALRLAVAAILACLVASVSFRGFGLLHWHDSQRVFELIALSVVSAAVLACPGSLRSVLREALRWLGPAGLAALCAAGALGIVSASRAASPRFALVEVSMLFLLLLCALVVARTRRREGARCDVVLTCTLLAVAAVLVAPFLVAWFAAMTSGAGFMPELVYQSGFSNVRFLGHFHTLALPVLACACFMPGLRPAYRVLVFLLLALTWTMAIGTATRATWVTWLAVALVLLPFARGRILPLLQAQLAGLALGALFAWLMFDRLPRMAGFDLTAFGLFIGRFSDPLALSSRDQLWMRALELIALHPWTGVGPMMLALDHNPVATHPHNALLQLAAEWGLPAALLLAFIGLRLWWKVASGLGRLQRRDPVAPVGTARYGYLLPLALLWAVTGAGVHAMIDGLLVMPFAQLACAVMLGWMLGLSGAFAGPTDRSSVPPAAAPRRAVPSPLQGAAWLGIAAAGLYVAAVTLPVIPQLVEREGAYEAVHPLDRPLKPRLWTQGWLHEDIEPLDPATTVLRRQPAY